MGLQMSGPITRHPSHPRNAASGCTSEVLGPAAQMQMGAACEEEAAEADQVTPPSLPTAPLHASLTIRCLWIELVPMKVMPQMSQRLPDGLEWPLTFGIVPGGISLGLSHTYFHPRVHIVQWPLCLLRLVSNPSYHGNYDGNSI